MRFELIAQDIYETAILILNIENNSDKKYFGGFESLKLNVER